MTPLQVIHRVRDLYVDQYQLFVDLMLKEFGTGAAEVQLRTPEETELYRSLMRSDFMARKDGTIFVRAFSADRALEFEKFRLSIGGRIISVENLRWDNAQIHHDLPRLPESAIDNWFEHHFDPGDTRYDQARRFGSYVHSLAIVSGYLSLDFGSAPVDALTSLVQLLADAGARTIEIGQPNAAN
jgi:hypothetical protein